MSQFTGRQFWTWLQKYIPDVFLKGSFNFITIHYLYMIGWAILGSVILYSIGGMRYIDSLFFASGSATQSGLNTIDIDLLHTGQQFTLYMMAMVCNPIFVHSFVVFVRLYWFEKRFKSIARNARILRKSKSRSRNNTVNKDDPEAVRQEKSVRGQTISVLRNTGRILERSADETELVDAVAESVESSHKTNGESADENLGKPQPRMAVDNGGLTGSPGEMPGPQRLDTDEQISFLENQRNPKDKSILRIPSPREFDRGGRPENVNLDEQDRRESVRQTNHPRHIFFDLNSRVDDANTNQHIKIEDPPLPRPRDKSPAFPRPHRRQEPELSPELSDASGKKTVRRTSFSSFRRRSTDQSLGGAPYLDFQPTVGRNSFFLGLTEEERDKLGGIEYRALKTLALTLIIYFFAWHAIGVIFLLPWILLTPTYGRVVTAQGQGRVWWAFFTAASAFNDLGFTLTADSMIEFGTAILPILLMTFLIVIGNTGFPCMLRFCIWIASKCVPVGTALWEEFRFLLDHPRRCFTLLFPSAATWWLFVILIILNGLDLIFFIVLDINDPVVTAMSGGIRFLDGLFQASSTRTAGFSVVNLAELHPAIQVSYLIMMYISAFPIAISMRRTNVYEEKSLGIYGHGAGEEEHDGEASYVGAHVRKQLGFDLWYVFLGLFVIAIVEGNRLQNTNQYAFTLFSVLFEIVSAYGTVGLSLGYPNINASFSAEFSVLSKLVIIAMQIRGRHRGLPYELDRAILLPSDSLQQNEQAEAARIMARRRSSAAMSDTSAVTGTDPSRQFRPETGLASGYQGGANAARERNRGPGDRENLMQRAADGHQSHLRQGLGSAMFRLAPHAEADEPKESTA